MSLLNEVMYRPVDPSYAEAAARGPVERSRAARGARTLVSVVVAVALGIVTASAVVQLRAPRAAVQDGRELLGDEIRQRTAAAEALRRENDAVAQEIAALQDEALSRADPVLVDQLRRYELLSGATPVTGPGLVLTLDDPPRTDDGPIDPRARVQDVDLQIVVNALWAAGAEAIAVGGERLTSLSAIRSAGSAILVDLAPLEPPYRIEAIGDVSTMQTEFARSAAGSHLSVLEGNYGVSTSLDASSALELPASGGMDLRFADATVAVGGSPTRTPEEETG